MIEKHKTVWVAENAVLTGDITIGEGSSVWYGSVLRGDEAPITIGKNTNIQDGAILHEAAKYPLVIGDGVTVGHRAVLHGCEIGNNVVVGMGSIVKEAFVEPDGKARMRRWMPLGITADERVCSGAHYAAFFADILRLLDNPEELETPPKEVRFEQGVEYHVPKVK